ncbi:MAG: insulinase family protein [Paludibacter sp.]|nr:insulinase family protein [Paludibacter sp.]
MRLIKLILIFCFGIFISGVAQKYNLSDQLSVDKNIRVGKLPNGLTYYIRKNIVPKDRVELRLAINAGSILEDDDQQGLAHFTEHMAFNGTKHFSKNELISYLQSVGIKFGKDLNAYTSFNETVYRLLVPTEKEEVVDNALLVLEDWAHNITFDPKEIESERGVITEEWRIGRGANQRLQDVYFPVVYHQSRYAQRLPIGKKEVIDGFKPETIRRYYNDWYRPDLMAVVVVGDIDVDKYEQKIKDHFNTIPTRTTERPRPVFDVPNHSSTLFSINTDKEATQTQVMVYSKTGHKDETTLGDYRGFIIEQLYHLILNERLGELGRSENPPYVSANSHYQAIARNKDAFNVSARVKQDGVERGLKAILEEVERVKRFGFTESELDRAKKNVFTKYERTYNERDKSESDGYASELVRNFLAKEPIPGVPFECEFEKNQLPTITLKEVNDFDNTFLSDSNRVIVVTGPAKEGVKMPTEESLLAIVNQVPKTELTALEDKKVTFVWPGKKPTPGTIVKEEKDESLNMTTLTLSNGAKVFLKPTDFKNDEIYGIAYSKGGHSLCSDSDFYSAIYASTLVNESGIANLSKTDKMKAFVGKEVSVSPFINATSEGLSGKTSPKDLETFMQLTNLYFTQAQIDSTAFKTFITKTKSSLSTLQLNPQKYFEDQVSRTMSCNNPRGGGFPTPADLDKVDMNRSLEIYKERFANAGDFNFVFVGSFNPDQIKPLIETYIASLPATKGHEKCKDLGIRPPKGKVEKVVNKGSDQKSSVNLTFTNAVKFTDKEEYLLESLNDVLTIKFMENLREKKSGVYGVRSSGRVNKFPYENYVEHVTFQCAPENVESLITAALDEIEKVKKNGVDDKDLTKVRLAQKNELEMNLKTNVYWANEMTSDVVNGKKITDGKDGFQQIEQLSSKDLQQFAKKIFGSNYSRFVLLPEIKK